MAKPRKSKTGSFTLMVSFDHQRRNLTLGKLEKKEADLFAANVDSLVSHCKLKPKSVPVQLESWVQSLSDRHREQLAELGILGRFNSALTVGELIDEFIEEYELTGNAESTKRQFKSSMENRIPAKLKKRLVVDLEPRKDHDRPNAEAIFSKDAKSVFRDTESWQRNHFAKSTWSRANGRLREIGEWAVRQGVCNHNPFILLPRPGETNDERNVDVLREWVDDAMDMCLDPDTRLGLALGRYSGFRTPSEARTLKPEHIDFDKLQLKILDSKEKKFRVMPLFDQVRDELERHRESVGGWDRFVLTSRFRTNSDANNFNLIKESIARAGHELWPRLRQNLRSSCENELLEVFDERLVTLWLGHTVKTSRKHYQKPKDSDYVRAVAKIRTA